MHVSIKAESLEEFINLPLTNSNFATILLLLIFLSFILIKIIPLKWKLIPGNLQNFLEFIIETLDNFVQSIAAEKGRIFLPVIGGFLFFIWISNWMGLLPGFGSIGFYEEIHGKKILVPLFRGPTADLNTTLVLGFLSFASIQYFGFIFNKNKHLKHYFNFSSPIDAFVGLLDLISDFIKIFSFAFRLFGNIFAGEVLLTVISYVTFGLAVFPFMGLEIFVGFIQSLVFAMLTLVFINMATAAHTDH